MMEIESGLPLSGPLIKAVIGSFASKPKEGDDSSPFCSIGIAEDSIVATDTRSAILIGDEAECHVATTRKEALLEAERARLYGEPVRLNQIERQADTITGVEKDAPACSRIISQGLSKMLPLATVNPSALVAIGKVAAAAGARSVQLWQPEGDPSALGFTFEFEPEEEFQSLFSSWEGAISAKGIFTVRPVKKEGDDEE